MTAIRAAVRERWGEVAAFALLTAVGAAVAASSFSYGVMDDGGRVGPGFMPLVLGGLLFALGGAQLVSRLRPSAVGDSAEPAPSEQPKDAVVSTEPRTAAPPPGDRRADTDAVTGADTGFDNEGDAGLDSLGRTQAYRIRQLWTVAAAIIVGLLLVPYLGFLVAFGALVLFISVVVEQRPWLGALVITAVAVAVVHGVFGVFLNVPLPTGFLDLASGS